MSTWKCLYFYAYEYTYLLMGSFSIMDQLNLFQRKMKNTKLKLSDLNPHLMCVLCGGYYIDATTIVECLHSFCRSCIVKHLESSKYCPICEVQVHKTKPLINIRPDKTLQDIVYKLVPGLFANEMRNRRRFYKERPHYIKPNNLESIGEVSGDRKIYVNDENITFSLVYHIGSTTTGTTPSDIYKEVSPPNQNEKRYFKCPTGVTIYHLKKLLKTKYELNDSNYKVEVYLKDQPLHDNLTLLDISYIYLWKNPKGSLDFTYKIFENVVKRPKLEEKESQRNITEPTKVLNDVQNPIDGVPKKVVTKEEKIEGDVKKEKETERREEKNIGLSQSETRVNPPMVLADNPSGTTEIEKSDGRGIKENGVSGGEGKEVQLQISESGLMIVSEVEDGEVVRTMEDAPVEVMNNQLITSLGLGSEKSKRLEEGEATKRIATEVAPKSTSKSIKSYKTIRCSPKTWNPVIPKEKLRPTLMKNSDEPKKPLKFFKMRNMPRFLGNPSSGVKPMYASEPEEKASGEEKKKKNQEQMTCQQTQAQSPHHGQEKKAETTTKNKILKIDPKTLRPIEKEDIKVTQTPNLPNLLTNPFIPNNNHFLFSDLHLLPPHSGNFSNAKADVKSGVEKPASILVGGGGGFKAAGPNGGYPPVCFPSPDHNPGFYPFSNLAKPQSFPFPVGDKMDPLLRASRLSPFGNLSGFNVAGFHASLPPSISRLLNPHQHFRKINQNFEKRNNNKDESTKETTKTTKNNCDDSLKVKSGVGEGNGEKRKREEKEDRGKEGDKRGEKEKSKTEMEVMQAINQTTKKEEDLVEEKREKRANGDEGKREDKPMASSVEKNQTTGGKAGEKEGDKRDNDKEGVNEVEDVGKEVKKAEGSQLGEKGGENGGEKPSESASKAIDKSESNSESNKSIDRDR